MYLRKCFLGSIYLISLLLKLVTRDLVCYPLKKICRDPKREQLCGITAVGGFGLSILAQGNGNDFQSGRDLFTNVGDKLR